MKIDDAFNITMKTLQTLSNSGHDVIYDSLQMTDQEIYELEFDDRPRIHPLKWTLVSISTTDQAQLAAVQQAEKELEELGIFFDKKGSWEGDPTCLASTRDWEIDWSFGVTDADESGPKIIELPCFDIKIQLYADGLSGEISSNLKESKEDAECDGALQHYNTAIQTVLNLILAHAIAGVDIQSAAYLEGIDSTVFHIQDHLEGNE